MADLGSFSQGSIWPTGTYSPKGRRLWCVVGAFAFHWPGGMIEAPSGFVTDLASVPVILPEFIQASMCLSGVIHDVCRRDPNCSFRDGDRIFALAMKAEGVPAPIRWLAYAAVRCNRRRD